ncbi:hypothetical protein QJQ45_004639 [Haematococcus lacustris]|nr:hypothetical protein QJQ45_004639 [Haematococcus lacustris]
MVADGMPGKEPCQRPSLSPSQLQQRDGPPMHNRGMPLGFKNKYERAPTAQATPTPHASTSNSSASTSPGNSSSNDSSAGSKGWVVGKLSAGLAGRTKLGPSASSDANVADAGTAGPAYASLSALGAASRANAAAARPAVSDVAGPAESDAGVANVGTARPAWDFGTAGCADEAAACAVATFVPGPSESDAAATDTQRHPANSTIPTPIIHHLSVPICASSDANVADP